MNIRKIIREELEGFKDSNEEDWEWTEGSPLDFTGGEIYIDFRGLDTNQKKEIFSILEKELGELNYHEGVPRDNQQDKIDKCSRDRNKGIFLHCGFEDNGHEDGLSYQPVKNDICCMGDSTYEQLKSETHQYHEFGVEYINGRDLLGLKKTYFTSGM